MKEASGQAYIFFGDLDTGFTNKSKGPVAMLEGGPADFIFGVAGRFNVLRMSHVGSLVVDVGHVRLRVGDLCDSDCARDLVWEMERWMMDLTRGYILKQAETTSRHLMTRSQDGGMR